MPISATSSCTESHWQEVLSILQSAVEGVGFEGNLVSEATDVGVIQKRIVQNLYENPVVVCDVSEKNPNVMFELGMRLAFDKPVVIIKDDKTNYSFDTSPVEHLTYPRDLRFTAIVEFKEKLGKKVASAAASESEHSFLASFGSFKVAELNVESAPADRLILEELEVLKREVRQLRFNPRATPGASRGLNFRGLGGSINPRITLKDVSADYILLCLRGYEAIPDSLEECFNDSGMVNSWETTSLGEDHLHVRVNFDSQTPHVIREEFFSALRKIEVKM